MLSKNKAKSIEKSLKTSPGQSLGRIRETDNRNRVWVNPDMVALQMLEELKYIADNLNTASPEEKKSIDVKDLLVLIAEDPRADSNYLESELKLGIIEELEHTNDVKIAKVIAKTHLEKDPNYYSKNKLSASFD